MKSHFHFLTHIHAKRLACSVFCLAAAAVGLRGAPVTGTNALTITDDAGSASFAYSGSTERFLWDGYKKHLQAGLHLPAYGTVGTYSLSFGDYPESTGNYSLAYGYVITASGDHSLVFGAESDYGMYASGDYSLAFGLDDMVSGAYSWGAGYGNYVTGSTSLGFGYFNTVSGSYGAAIGRSNMVSESYALGLGYSNISDGVGSFVAGYDNSADGKGSVVMGQYSIVDLPSGEEATLGAYAFGRYLDVGDAETFVIGRYNDKGATDGDGYLFVIGNGSSGSLSDAFRVSESGDVWASGTFDMDGNAEVRQGILINEDYAGTYSRTSSTNADHALSFDAYLSSTYGGTHTAGRIYGENTSYQDTGSTGGWTEQALVLEAGYDWDTYRSYQLVLASSGNVGIGTPTPGATLDVNGDVIIQGQLTQVSVPARGGIGMGGFD